MPVDLPGARRTPAPTLCRGCQVAAGFWPASDPLCPTCVAVAREAGE